MRDVGCQRVHGQGRGIGTQYRIGASSGADPLVNRLFNGRHLRHGLLNQVPILYRGLNGLRHAQMRPDQLCVTCRFETLRLKTRSFLKEALIILAC
ncbi:hypothetical protein CGLAMM_01365 [Acetobacteraceae bacterium EV16G]